MYIFDKETKKEKPEQIFNSKNFIKKDLFEINPNICAKCKVTKSIFIVLGYNGF